MASGMNAALKGMKLLQSRVPHKKKLVEPIKPSRWTIFRGDKVEVINGPEKGKQGMVLKVLREQNRVVIEGVNVRRRTQKPTPSGQPGKMITYPAALNVSNVNLVCPETNQPTKVSRRFQEDGTRVRVAKRSGALIPKPEYKRENIRRAAAGPKDTAPADVYEVTFEDYAAPIQKAKKAAAAEGGGGEGGASSS